MKKVYVVKKIVVEIPFLKNGRMNQKITEDDIVSSATSEGDYDSTELFVGEDIDIAKKEFNKLTVSVVDSIMGSAVKYYSCRVYVLSVVTYDNDDECEDNIAIKCDSISLVHDDDEND